MSSSEVFHLGLTREAMNGAKLAIVPGDPERVERIAELIDNSKKLASTREFTTWLGTLGGESVIICSTGIGGPSTSIAVEELAQLGIRTFLRAGTTGAIQPYINVGDVIITTGSVRMDGASQHFAPVSYPAVADFQCTQSLVNAAEQNGLNYWTGITASSDTFYPGQERYDTYTQRVRKELQGAMAEWQSMGVLNYEMESATLLTMCATMGLKAGCVAGVVVNRTRNETPDTEKLTSVEPNTINTVIESARLLLKQ